ncbi:MAG: hypothetical protein ABTQ34_08015 [Bdellovibrionales bacterium]
MGVMNMQGKLVGFFVVLFFLLGLAVAYFSGALTLRGRDQLLATQRQIDKLAEETRSTGHSSKVTFFSEDSDVIVVLLPAYAVVKDLEGLTLDQRLMEEIQRRVNDQETGHLFLIARGRIKDHKILSGLIEPVPGFSARQGTAFLISNDQQGSRPVRVAITVD